jgi:DnaJ-class molecular chaperone
VLALQLLHDAERRLKMAKRKDYYKALGVSKDASERVIKKAYRELARIHHPDKASEADRKDAEVRFRDIAEAAEVLTDEEKRRK